MKRLLMIATVLAAFSSTGTLAADKAAPAKEGKEAKMEFTKDQREKMAVQHEKMAACLRSDKSFHECHEEMMKNCEDTLGKEHCAMMKHMGKHHHDM